MFIEPSRTRPLQKDPRDHCLTNYEKINKPRFTLRTKRQFKTILFRWPFFGIRAAATGFGYIVLLLTVSVRLFWSVKQKILFEMRESWPARGSGCSGDRALAQHPWTNCEPERQSSPDVTGLILQKSFSTAASFRLTC